MSHWASGLSCTHSCNLHQWFASPLCTQTASAAAVHSASQLRLSRTEASAPWPVAWAAASASAEASPEAAAMAVASATAPESPDAIACEAASERHGEWQSWTRMDSSQGGKARIARLSSHEGRAGQP